MNQSTQTKGLLFLFLCSLCWGPSYLFIKIAVPHIPPLTLVFLRVAIGASLLYLLCRFQKHSIWKWKHLWRHFVVMGVTLNALPFFLISFGELYIASSLAGILNSLTLIITALLAHFFGTHERFTKNKAFGIFCGLIGLGVIYLPLLFEKAEGSALGVLMMIGASCSYGIGTVYARTHLQKAPNVVVLTSQLLFASLIVLPLSLLIDRPFSLPLPPLESVLAALALGVIATAGGFFFYYKTIQLGGATYASFSVLIVPIFAMILGALILHEHLTWNVYLGALFILGGLLILNPAFTKKS